MGPLLVLGIVSMGPGCGCGASHPSPPTVPPPASAPISSATPEVEPPPTTATLDLAAAESLLADPRLADVARSLEMGDPDGAALTMARVIATSTPPDDVRARWMHFLGKLHTATHHGAEARAAYVEASKASWPLAAYSACAAAQ